MPRNLKAWVEDEGVPARWLADSDRLGDMLSDAYAELFADLPRRFWLVYAEGQSVDATTGLTLSDLFVVEVFGGDRPATEVNHSLGRQLDSGQLTAQSNHPLFYRLGGKLYVKPAGTNTAYTVTRQALRATDSSITIGSVTLPTTILRLVALLTAIRYKDLELQRLRTDLPSALDTLTLLSLPSAPSITYSAASQTDAVTASVGALPLPPSYSGPTLSLTSPPTIADLTVSASAPTPPSAPTISYSDAAAATVSATSIAALPTAPSYTGQSLTATTPPTVGALDLTKKADGITANPAPTAPSAPAITYDDASAGTIAQTSVGALPAVPTYNAPSFGGDLSLPSLPTLSVLLKADGVTALAVPTPPSAPSISYTDATVASIAQTSLASLPTAPAYSAASFGGSLTAPVIADSDLSKKIDGVTALSVPSAPSAPTIAAVDATVASIAQTSLDALPTAPSYSAPSFGGSLTPPTVADADLSKKIDGVATNTLPTPPSAPTISYSDASASSITAATWGALPTAPAYSAVSPSLTFTEWDTREADDDDVMAARVLDKITLELQEARSQIEDNLATYQDGLEEYRAQVQELLEEARAAQQAAVENARLATEVSVQNEAQTLAAAIADYEGELRAYSHELATFQAEVSRVIEEWRLNADKDIALYREEQMLHMQQYANAITAARDEFQGELDVYRAGVERLIRQGDLDQARLVRVAELTTDLNLKNEAATLRGAIADYQGELQRYDRQLGEYDAELRRVVEEFRLNAEKDIALYKEEQTLHMQQYGTAVAAARDEFQGALDEYRAGVQRLIRQGELDQARLVESARLSTEASVQDEARTLEAAIADYRETLQHYEAEVAEYQAELGRVLEKYRADYEKAVEPWSVQQRGYLEEYGRLIEAERDRYAGQMADFEREVDRLIEQARLDQARLTESARLSTEVSVRNEAETAKALLDDYVQTLGLFRLETALYQAEVQVVIEQYRVKLQEQIRLYGLERGAEVQQFAAEIQDARAAFDAELALYSAGVERNRVQAEITAREAALQAQLTTDVAVRNEAETLRAAIEDYALELRLFAEKVRSYGEEVRSEISEFQANAEKNLRLSELTRSGELREFELELRKSRDTVDVSLADYQREVDRLIEQARIDRDQLSQDARQTDEVALRNARETAATELREYELSMLRYQAEVSRYRAALENTVSETTYQIQRQRTQARLLETEIARLRARYAEDRKALLRSHAPDHGVTLAYHDF